LIIGSNWFLGYSHTSRSKDEFLRRFQRRERIAEILKTFLSHGIDAILAPPSQHLEQAIKMAEDQTGLGMIRLLPPSFNLNPEGPHEMGPE
jgi:hypothetical protein